MMSTTLQLEPYVDASKAAEFLGWHRQTVLERARRGEIPAHPLLGKLRKKWGFRLSELDAWARAKVNSSGDPCRRKQGGK